VRFTRSTYRRAVNRSLALEYQAFMDHHRALRGPEAWIRQWVHTNRLMDRKARERGNA
jgi:hypothetical protein